MENQLHLYLNKKKKNKLITLKKSDNIVYWKNVTYQENLNKIASTQIFSKHSHKYRILKKTKKPNSIDIDSTNLCLHVCH